MCVEFAFAGSLTGGGFGGLADALIKDINFDKEVAAASAARPAYKAYASDAFFTKPSTLPPPESDPALPRVQPVTIV